MGGKFPSVAALTVLAPSGHPLKNPPDPSISKQPGPLSKTDRNLNGYHVISYMVYKKIIEARMGTNPKRNYGGDPNLLKRYPEPVAHGPEARKPMARKPGSRHTRTDAVNTVR